MLVRKHSSEGKEEVRLSTVESLLFLQVIGWNFYIEIKNKLYCLSVIKEILNLKYSLHFSYNFFETGSSVDQTRLKFVCSKHHGWGSWTPDVPASIAQVCLQIASPYLTPALVFWHRVSQKSSQLPSTCCGAQTALELTASNVPASYSQLLQL